MFSGRFTKIEGISERRRLPRLGKIRLGVKVLSKKGTEYPKEVDYFVVPPEVAKVYGDKPKELDIMVPINDLGVVFPQAYKWYGSQKGLKCIGDGAKAARLNEETKAIVERECPCELLEKECFKRAHFMVILPRINMGGVYQIDSGSYHSMVDINSGLEYVEVLVGRFAMVPLKLRRVARETHEGGIKSVHYPLQVILDADINLLNQLREDNKRVLMGLSALAIEGPEDTNPAMDEEGVVVIEENGDGVSEPPATTKPQPATKQQIAAIKSLSKKHGKVVNVEGLTTEQAVEIIKSLQQEDGSKEPITIEEPF